MARVEGLGPTDVERIFNELARAWATPMAAAVLTLMRVESPVDTGALRTSHVAEPPRREGGDWVVRFVATVPYGAYVHQGLPNGIVPRRASVLRFELPDGTVVFTRRVRPRAGNPWMVRAFQRAGFPVVVWLPPHVASV